MDDCRIDRRTVGEPQDLARLTWERMEQALGPAQDSAALLEQFRRLANGQWALLLCEVADGHVAAHPHEFFLEPNLG